MTDPTVPDDPKRQMKANFSSLAATYDDLRFLQLCATRLAELAALSPGARVLDVATGTGVVALRAAQIVGPTGQVVAVDLSLEMLARARQKLGLAGPAPVEFREGDVEHLDLPDHAFDVALCASSLFFIPNMLNALRECRRVLAPGGQMGFSSFGPTFLQPLRDLWVARLRQYGLAEAALPTHRLADLATCEQLLREAGFTEIEVKREQLGYTLPNAEARWADIVAGIEGKPIMALSATQHEQIKAEHLAELAALSTAQGIWLDVPALFAFGRRTAMA